MNFLKYTSYLYLVFGLFFLYEGYTSWAANEPSVLNFIIAGLAIFMFFFRMKFAKKFEDRNKKS